MAGRQPTSAIVLEGTTRAITAWIQAVSPVTVLLSVPLFPGHLLSISLSAPPVMRMISNAKGITLAAKTVQLHKTGIAPVVDVTGLVTEILIDIKSSGNRFGDQSLELRVN